MNAPDGFVGSDHGLWAQRIAGLSKTQAAELARRARHAPLFMHAYSLHLNFRFGDFKPIDLLDFAAEQKLIGVKIHVEDGEEANSLLTASDKTRAAFADHARALGLKVHIETSSTALGDLEAAIEVARAVGGVSVRSYPRYEAHVSEIIARTIDDLKALSRLDPEGKLLFTLEQHEDLNSTDLVGIVEAVGNPHLSLLFDFGNMINAYERPLEALRIQAPHVTEVHVKDCHVVPDRGGWAQTGCISGTGDLPFADLLVELLLLGRDKPQVTALALEEEVDYHAPAMRFPDETDDPFIPFRTASLTPFDVATLPERMARERQEALGQIITVRSLLQEIESLALEVAC
ncbi:sugar phosphate isomerase/epimerase family protein [Limibacillus halophilus]|uniref:Sugar phosphate isomerase/epimerase n=1 Tax=Limibacillus halophilus TaxID=1579333 RepID=A0A839SX08_9PROT|nr:TIM barrel protein [Limibacillus halophilus]MBB3066194.1 sugar phosphate isomerase/epimerase [Limibacillus halophilus]